MWPKPFRQSSSLSSRLFLLSCEGSLTAPLVCLVVADANTKARMAPMKQVVVTSLASMLAGPYQGDSARFLGR